MLCPPGGWQAWQVRRAASSRACVRACVRRASLRAHGDVVLAWQDLPWPHWLAYLFTECYCPHSILDGQPHMGTTASWGMPSKHITIHPTTPHLVYYTLTDSEHRETVWCYGSTTYIPSKYTGLIFALFCSTYQSQRSLPTCSLKDTQCWVLKRESKKVVHIQHIRRLYIIDHDPTQIRTCGDTWEPTWDGCFRVYRYYVYSPPSPALFLSYSLQIDSLEADNLTMYFHSFRTQPKHFHAASRPARVELVLGRPLVEDMDRRIPSDLIKVYLIFRRTTRGINRAYRLHLKG